MIPMVDLKAQYGEIRAEIEQGLGEVLDSAQFILGPHGQAFERETAAYLGSSHAVSCASGTDALHLALVAAGVGPGDEVITTPFTFIATAEVICYVGATPVFVDIDPGTFNLDLVEAERAITARTRAILPVHLFGQPVDADACRTLASEHGLLMIEDCAQSFGAAWRGRQSGTFGIAGCFSFFPSKNLGGCGDGGLVCTDSDAVAEELRVLRNHGSRERYHHHVIGFNSRLDEFQAVILRAKLRRIDAYNAGRRQVAARYDQAFAGSAGITPPAVLDGAHHVYHQYTVLLDSERESVMEKLREAGSASAVYYPIPLHRQDAFKEDCRGLSLPVAESVARRCLSLPIYPELDAHRQQLIIDALRGAAVG